MADLAKIVRKKCPRCKSLYLVSLPRKKGQDTEVGECATPLCYALKHYTAEEWEGKARMARSRLGVDDFEITRTYDSDDNLVSTACSVPRKPNAFDVEALKRFP